MSLESRLGDADWLAAYGQVGGAIFTAMAVAVALWVALRDSRLRRQEERDHAKAQARLVLSGHKVSVSSGGVPRSDKETVYYGVHVEWENLGDRAILDLSLRCQVSAWTTHDDRYGDRLPMLQAGQPYLKARKKATLSLHATQVSHMQFGSCEISWTDADGRLWRRDLDPALINSTADEERTKQAENPAFLRAELAEPRHPGALGDP